MKGSHPHKAIATALKVATSAGFEVVALHRGHVWGKVIARNGQELSVWSTPRNPEVMAKRIMEFVRRYGEAGP